MGATQPISIIYIDIYNQVYHTRTEAKISLGISEN